MRKHEDKYEVAGEQHKGNLEQGMGAEGRFLSARAVFLSACMLASLPACLSPSLPACLPRCLPACLPACQPACLPASLPRCLPACGPVLYFLLVSCRDTA